MLKRSLSLMIAVIMIVSVFAVLPITAGAEERVDGGSVELAPVAAEEQEGLSFTAAEEEPAAVAADAAALQDYPVISKIENANDGAHISWHTYNGNRYYRVYYLSENGWVRLATVNGNSYTDKTVSVGQTRVYTLRCVNNAEGKSFTSGFSAEGWSNTYYAFPVIDSLTNTVDGVHLKWTLAEDAQLYRLYRKVPGGGWVRIAQLAEGEYTDTTVVSGTAYTYTLRMIYTEDESFMSGHNGGKSITYISAPVITGVDNGDHGAVIRWNACKGAAAYRVYYQNGENWVRLGQTSATSFTDTTAKHNEPRVYTVRCVNKDGAFVSDFYRDNEPHTYIHFTAPVIDSLESTVDGVLIKWTRAEGAEDYRVYRKAAGDKSWLRLTQTAQSDYLDTTAASGVTYTYTLRMISADGERFMSDFNGGKSIVCVAPPRITGFENTKTGVKITWTKTSGAAAYRVFVSKNNAWAKLIDVKTNTAIDTEVKNEESRTYTVRALDKKGMYCSDYLSKGWQNTYYAAPEIKSIEKFDDGVRLTWDRPEGAEDYRVYRKTAGKSWTRLGQVDGSDFTDTTALSGVNYTYTIRMIRADKEEFMSDFLDGKSITFCDTPKLSSLTNGAEGVKLTWNKVEHADHYGVLYMKEGLWTKLADVKAVEYTDTSVEDGESRVYSVRCYDSANNAMSDFNRCGTSITFFAPPVITSVEKTNNGYNKITWEEKQGVAGYRLYRKSPGGSWARLFDSISDNSYTDESSDASRIYTYTLRYTDAEGNLISDYIADTKYYVDGVVADGDLTEDGNAYHFDSGILLSGFRTVNGKKYYYGKGGAVVKNNIVGSDQEGWYYADSKGVCCESEEIRLAAQFMAKYCKGNTLQEKMKNGFMYMANNIPYKRYYDPPKKAADIPHLAVECFKNRNANCYRYAAAFCCMARMAGYRARMAVGITGSAPHGWTEVYVNGRWLICDVDANLPQYHSGNWGAYMMTSHFWPLSKYFTAELTISDGKATWK